MQYWFWWNLSCGLNVYVNVKFSNDEVRYLHRRNMQSLIHLDMPVTAGSKAHIVKGLYVLRDFLNDPLKKINVTYELERYKKKNQISLKSVFSNKQLNFYFQALYTKVLDLYALRKLKLEMFITENGLLIFNLQDMIGVTKSYDLFKWSYQIKVNVNLNPVNTLNNLQNKVCSSYFILLK